MKELKPKPIATNVNPMLKEFLLAKKITLKKKFNKHFTEEGVLLYYLNGNYLNGNNFTEDFANYCAEEKKLEEERLEEEKELNDADMLKLLTE